MYARAKLCFRLVSLWLYWRKKWWCNCLIYNDVGVVDSLMLMKNMTEINCF